jgi:hypothetical protein
MGGLPSPSTQAADHGLANLTARRVAQPRSPRSSIRQFEAVAFWSFLAARLRWIRLALAAHAWKDDDLSARRLGAVARLSARVPRTEVKYHSHCVPLAGRCAPRPPHRMTRTQLRGESPYLTATGVNGLLTCRRGTGGHRASQSSRKCRPCRSSTETIQMSGSKSICRSR